MTIDPRVGFWLSIILAVVSFVSASPQLFVDAGLPAGDVTHVVAICAIVVGVGNAINAALHAIPASNPDTTAQASKFLLGPKAP